MSARTIYNAWVAVGTTFDPTTHARHDETLLSFQIEEREGEYPAATLTIQAPTDSNGNLVGLLNGNRGRLVFLSEDDGQGSAKLIFAGRVTGSPSDQAGETIDVELIAQPDDWQTKRDTLISNNKTAPYYDSLFTDPTTPDQPEDVLAGRAAHFHWDRTAGTVSIVSLIDGDGTTVDLSGKHLYDSLSVDLGDPPVREVKVTAQADWEQRDSGSVDVAPQIKGAFPNGYMETLTGEDLRRRWPRPGFSLGGASGYEVEDSELAIDTGIVEASADDANTGTGSIGSVSVGSAAKNGRYTIVVYTTNEDFVVLNPDNEQLGTAQGSFSSNEIDFTISLSPDRGDAFYVDVNFEQSQAFNVLVEDYPFEEPEENDVASGTTRSVRFKIWRFAPTLTARWQYRQSRREEIAATVQADTQDLLQDAGEAKEINLRTADITVDRITPDWQPNTSYTAGDLVLYGGSMWKANDNHTSSSSFWVDELFGNHWTQQADDQSALGSVDKESFWLTTRGEEALQHLLARAAAQITASSRAVEITARVPWRDGIAASVANQVTLSDARLPGGGAVTAKCSRWAARHDGTQAYVDVTLSAAIGTGATYSAGTGETQVPNWPNLIYSDYDATTVPANDPPTPVDLGSMGSGSYAVQDVVVNNARPAQETYLANNDYPTNRNIEGVLRETRTQIDLRMRSIAASDRQEHAVNVSLPHPYPPPKQIDLKA